MVTTALYEIETSEADDGTTGPAEGIWTPGEDAAYNGFVVHRGLYVTGIAAPNDDGLYPDRFVVLGHQRWADTIEAADAYMDRIHGWRALHLYPGDDQAELMPRIPRTVLTHGVFLRHPHPHPDHPCGCEWRHLARGVGAGHRTRSRPHHRRRHPAAPATTASIPNPDEEGAPATWTA
ncbi:hypothetical protein ABVB69_38395 [Streptomyces sp. NPDC000349]|uniref:hypothetical protein n=1 Tax=unclassified Streptomyces TaxID=2593676 RepID=UPI002789A07F|nr:hypothetical protein [Streptomyces sp. DSM 40167]MDQ0408770.1 hypothetical protein [Streptomyces sp. DSM 40167]